MTCISIVCFPKAFFSQLGFLENSYNDDLVASHANGFFVHIEQFVSLVTSNLPHIY